MKSNESFSQEAMSLPNLDESLLEIIKVKGEQMEGEIAAAIDQFEYLLIEGQSDNGFVSIIIDGNHQVHDVLFNSSFIDWQSDKAKTCALITEAMNDAIYKSDLAIESQLSTIQYKYTAEVIDISNHSLKPDDINLKFKRVMSDVRKK